MHIVAKVFRKHEYRSFKLFARFVKSIKLKSIYHT